MLCYLISRANLMVESGAGVSVKPLRMQPTFAIELSEGAADAIRRLKDAIGNPELRNHVVAAGACLEFQIASAEQRFWSPHLSVQVSDSHPQDGDHEPRSVLSGRFSPRPEIWTMFMAIYGVVTIVMCGAAMLGCVQWSLGGPVWPLLLCPIGLLIIGGLHAASLIGQNLSADQMDLLRSRLDHAIELAFADASQTEPANSI